MANTTRQKTGLIRRVACEASVELADAVRKNGAVLVQALADSKLNALVVGIVVKKHTSVLCDLLCDGVTDEIFSGLDASKKYFLSHTLPGKLTTVPVPTGSGFILIKIGDPLTDTRLIIRRSQIIIRS